MTTSVHPKTTAELATALRDAAGKVRLAGSGSRQDRLPPANGALTIALDRLDRIHRLDPGDQTCSVGAGIRLESLDAALGEHGLWLPCVGDGTVGGVFASDPTGATTAGGPNPRSLLLGMEAMLADGTEFRSGARVAKSVAGFDLHRLFVGSQGRLFAATELHLRLKPRPRASVWFEKSAADIDAVLGAFLELRREPVPPAALHLRRDDRGCALIGRFDGRATFVDRMLRRHRLPEGPPLTHLQLDPPAGGEVLTGAIPPSHCRELLAATDGPFLLHGGGRFELATISPSASDALLARLPGFGAHAAVAAGAAGRRGRGTPLDPGQQRLCEALARALDPNGTLV